MLTVEMCERLEAKARNARNNAKAEMAVNAVFIEEYREGLSGHPKASTETHNNSMEIYDFTIKGQHRARDYLADAVLYETAAAVGRARLAEQNV